VTRSRAFRFDRRDQEFAVIVGPSGLRKDPAVAARGPAVIEPTEGSIHARRDARHGPGRDRGMVVPVVTVTWSRAPECRMRPQDRRRIAGRTRARAGRFISEVGLEGLRSLSHANSPAGMMTAGGAARELRQ